MRIGIDISQVAYEGTGVSSLLSQLVRNLIKHDQENTYILFGSSLRQRVKLRKFIDSLGEAKPKNRVLSKIFPFPPTFLDVLWNKFHIIPIEWLIGDVDIFLSSDWTQPPTQKAKRVTILYDSLIYKFPQEMHSKIVETQKRRLEWVKRECNKVICISESTKKDAVEILGIKEDRLSVVYPGGVHE